MWLELGKKGESNMANLQLGNVVFAVDDLPDSLNLGGEHVLAVRKFPGGGVDVQPMGAFDENIQWQGTFMFQGAVEKAKTLDTMRVLGQPVYLTMSNFSRLVIIQKFTFDYQNDYYIPYSIELMPLGTHNDAQITINGLPETRAATMSIQSVGDVTPISTDTTTSSSSPSPQKTYTVVSGDTLWGIAVNYYNDGTQWPKIADANGVKNPRLLQIGTVLTIP
jgi:nucleoid-associated protein YgaU